MKKSIVFSALVCGIVMLLGSCAGSSLKSAAEALNAICPKQVNEIATMESVSYEDKALIVNYSIDDSTVSIDSLTSVLDVVKNQVLVRLQGSDDLKDYISTCREAGAIIKHIYTGKESGKSFTIELTDEDLQNILDGKVVPVQAEESESAREVEEAAENTVQKEENVIHENVRVSEVEAEEKK
jgi:hypothetical protein